jgi:hypothetical protein
MRAADFKKYRQNDYHSDGIFSIAMRDSWSNRRKNRQMSPLNPFAAIADRCQINNWEKTANGQ